MGTQYGLVLGAFHVVCGGVPLLLRLLMSRVLVPGVPRVLVPGMLVLRVPIPEVLMLLSIQEYTRNLWKWSYLAQAGGHQ